MTRCPACFRRSAAHGGDTAHGSNAALGQHLAEQGGRLDWQGTWALPTPVMDTLGQVHGAGLLHRDITPDNIYITHDGQAKLMDFGAARAIVTHHDAPHSLLLTRIQVASATVGSMLKNS
uniref:Protein kinase domain-containing protein n=1 Tax=Candidatus Kentrum eta TaxID=2126337 RepID=A0A450UA07_9GAMM|nr:MAG: Protein kinase domain-containing protein [Candidatus Kentron sp. H]VFJ88938.1 MAG: Protein kinase domain-containing protein [Candidatus Kentron sp. H]VFJ95675.1 MAG: Protein kinase domain-containing protein [Candidatus Kentron sp. H]